MANSGLPSLAPLTVADQFQQRNVNVGAETKINNDADNERVATDGKHDLLASNNSLQPNPTNLGGIDDDSYDCPLSVYSDSSLPLKSGVTAGNENNNIITNADEDDDDDKNNKQTTQTSHSATTPAEVQWPTDHPRNPQRDPNLSDLKFRFRVPNASFMRSNVLSPPHYLRGLPWKLFLMPKHIESSARQQHNRYWQNPPAGPAAEKSPLSVLGVFLQCNAEDATLSWSCHGEARIRLIGENNQVLLDRPVVHNFYHKENDWGFSTFLEYGKPEWNNAIHARDGALLIEIEALADPPHGMNWNSKRLTGYVGLKNQGATCYMNSLLQALYFTNYLRRAVYLISTELEDPSKSIPFQLQRLFFDLQMSSKPASTKRLTQAFGWDSIDSLVQHDVEEFCRMLLDNLEDKLKGTAMEGAINQLFEGRTISYIKCKNINYTSSRVETFMDVALNVKGLANVQDSFREYCSTDELVGDNQYDASDHGKQDAIKGIKFVQFPPVLHLHLKRFTYDIQTGDFVKINEKFEFPQHLDLGEYLDTGLYLNELEQIEDDDQQSTNSSSRLNAESIMRQPPPQYSLHAVFVHSGDHHGGHYVCYINPNCDGTSWYKFDDDVVSKCHARQAIEGNYGGTNDTSSRSCSNAYMLVYVRDFDRSRVLCSVTDRSDLNPMFFIRLNRQAVLDQRLEQQQAEQQQQPSCTLKILLDSDLRAVGSQPGMFDVQLLQPPSLQVRVSMNDTWREVHRKLATALNVPVGTLRIWPLSREVGDHVAVVPGLGANACPKWRLLGVHGSSAAAAAPARPTLPDEADDDAENFYPNAPPPQKPTKDDDTQAMLHMDRKLAVDLLVNNKPARAQHYGQQQQQLPVFCQTNNDEFLCWLQQSPLPPDTVSDGLVWAALPATSHTTHVLVFVKLYDPKYSLLHLERALAIKYEELNSFHVFYTDLYNQLLQFIPPTGGARPSRADDLWTWFDARTRELTAIAKVPQVATLHRQYLQEMRNGLNNSADSPLAKVFNTLVSCDGEAVIVQRAPAQRAENELGSSESGYAASQLSLYDFPVATAFVTEQLNMIRLVLQEREGGVGSQASFTNTASSAASTVSVNTNSSRSSPWPELVFEINQLLPLLELQKLVARRLDIDDYRKVMLSKLLAGGGFSAVGVKNSSSSTFGSSNSSSTNFAGNNNNNNNSNNSRESQSITKIGTATVADVVGSVPLQSPASYPKRRKVMLYTILPMPIEDFNSKREIEICYLASLSDAVDYGGPGGVERSLFVNQQSCVSDLLEVVRQQFQLPSETPLRLLEVINSTIRSPPVRGSADLSAQLFENSAKSKQFRAEPVPADQRGLSFGTNFCSAPGSSQNKAEILMPVAHFHKDTHVLFGTPFLVRVVESDTYATVKERIRTMLGTPAKEMDKWKLVVISMGKRADMLSNSNVAKDGADEAESTENKLVPVSELIKVRMQSGSSNWSSLWLGLDHVNNVHGGKPGDMSSGVHGTASNSSNSGQVKKVRGGTEKTLKIHN